MSETVEGEARKYRKVKPALPASEDTTIKGPGVERLTPGFLRHVGELLYGERWQVPLAARLSDVRGKHVAPSRVHQWMTLERPIQPWVYDALGTVAAGEASRLAERMRQVAELARRIADPVLADHAYAERRLDEDALGALHN